MSDPDDDSIDIDDIEIPICSHCGEDITGGGYPSDDDDEFCSKRCFNAFHMDLDDEDED